MKKNRFLIIGAVILFFGLLIQNRLYYERLDYLERDYGIDKAYAQISEGMSKDEVLQRITTYSDGRRIEPDEIYNIENGSEYYWSLRMHRGALRSILGLTDDEKTYRSLSFEFDKDDHLTGMYFGG